MSIYSRRVYFWVLVAVVASLLPLYVKQFDYWGTLGLANWAYFLVTVIVVVTATGTLGNREVVACTLKNVINSPHVLLYCAGLLFSQFLITLVYSELGWMDLARTGGYIISTFVCLLIFPCAIGQRGIRAFWNLLLGVGVLASALGLFVAFTGREGLLGLRLGVSRKFEIFGLYATSGPFNEANIFGFVCTIGFIAGLFRFSTKLGRCNRIASFLMIGICVAGVFFSWSRAMYLALLVDITMWVMMGVRRRAKLLILLMGLPMMPAVLNMARSNPTVDYLLQFSLGLSGRKILWPAAIRAIVDRPVTGYGINPFRLMSTVGKYGGSQWGDRLGSHNGFLDLGVQAGIMIPIVYMCVIVLAFYRLFKSSAPLVVKRTLATAMATSVIATSFLSYSLGGTSYGSFVLTILFGIGNAMPLIYTPLRRKQSRRIIGVRSNLIQETEIL